METFQTKNLPFWASSLDFFWMRVSASGFFISFLFHTRSVRQVGRVGWRVAAMAEPRSLGVEAAGADTAAACSCLMGLDLPQLGNLVTTNEKGTFAQREMRDLSRNASRQVPFARSIEISLKSLRISEDVRFVI